MKIIRQAIVSILCLGKPLFFRGFRYALISGALVLSGCQIGSHATSKSLFQASPGGWTVQQGQALWRPKRGMPELAGNVVLGRRADGCCFVAFEKTPITIASVETTPTQWLIRFPEARMEFSGRGPGPTRFAWLYLPAALAGQPLPACFRFQRKPGGAWRLENPGTAETLEGYLSL